MRPFIKLLSFILTIAAIGFCVYIIEPITKNYIVAVMLTIGLLVVALTIHIAKGYMVLLIICLAATAYKFGSFTTEQIVRGGVAVMIVYIIDMGPGKLQSRIKSSS